MTDFDSPDAADQGAGPEDGYRQTPAQLSAQIRVLNDEVAQLRRRLAIIPSDTRPLERQLTESSNRINALSERNEKLVVTLRDARAQLLQLKEEVDRLAQPPSGYGVFLVRGPGGLGRGVHRRPPDAARGVADRRGREPAARPAGPAERGPDRGRVRPVRRRRRGLRAARGARRGSGTGRRSRRRGTRRAPGRAADGHRRSSRAIRCWSTARPATPTSGCRSPRSRTSCWRRCRTSSTATSAA